MPAASHAVLKCVFYNVNFKFGGRNANYPTEGHVKRKIIFTPDSRGVIARLGQFCQTNIARCTPVEYLNLDCTDGLRLYAINLAKIRAKIFPTLINEMPAVPINMGQGVND